MNAFRLALLLLALAWPGILATAAAQTVVAVIPLEEGAEILALNPAGTRLYCVGGTRRNVSVIDTVLHSVVAIIPSGSRFPITIGPADIKVSPDGSRVYVANGAPDSVTVIDTGSNSVIATISAGPNPSSLALTPDGRKLYVGHGSGAFRVTVLDTRTFGTLKTIQVITLALAESMAMHPNGSRLYVSGGTSSVLSVIDTASDGVAASVPASGWRPFLSPDSSRLYLHDPTFRRVNVVNTANNTLLTTIPVATAAEPLQTMAITPNGARLYVTHAFGIDVIDAQSNTLLATLTSFPNTVGLAASADSATLFVARGGSIDFLDVATNTVRGSVAASANPLAGPLVSPDGTRLFVGSGGVTVIDTRPPAATVSAASFARGASLAPESIASVFGQRLASATQTAGALPLPTSLAGTSVRVRDNAGVERIAPLFFVSSGQINFLIPAGTRNGPASTSVTSGDRVVAFGTLQIESIAPALFTANADGRGAAAGLAQRVATGGPVSFQLLYQCGAAPGTCTPAPIDLGDETDQVILLLFGTGLRGRSALSAVSVKVGGSDAPALYAGPQPDYVGLDQLNVRLPKNLLGRGDVELLVTVDGKAANPVRIALK